MAYEALADVRIRPCRFTVVSRFPVLPPPDPFQFYRFTFLTDFATLAHLMALPFIPSVSTPSCVGILPFARDGFTFPHFLPTLPFYRTYRFRLFYHSHRFSALPVLTRLTNFRAPTACRFNNFAILPILPYYRDFWFTICHSHRFSALPFWHFYLFPPHPEKHLPPTKMLNSKTWIPGNR